MSEIIPSFDNYHQSQIVNTFRAIGKYLLDSLLEAGKSMTPRVPDIDANVITDEEINNFARRCETSEFDQELAVLTRDTSTD